MITIDFSPLFPWAVLITLAVLSAILLGYGIYRRARGIAWRSAALVGLLLALTNPVAVEKNRDAKPDILAVVVDDSTSQKLGNRARSRTDALAHIEKTVHNLRNIELAYYRAGASDAARGPVDGTRLFKALERATADVPQPEWPAQSLLRMARYMTFLMPRQGNSLAGPVHVLLTGKRKEFDRRIIVQSVPKYGIVDKEVELTIRIEDTQTPEGTVPVSIVQDGGPPKQISVPIGRDHTVKVNA